MIQRMCIKVHFICCLLLLGFSLQAQYSVSGGRGVPLLAKDDTYNRLQVYLLNGMGQSEIRYTSASSLPHNWYRYKNSALNAEPVAATQHIF